PRSKTASLMRRSPCIVVVRANPTLARSRMLKTYKRHTKGTIRHVTLRSTRRERGPSGGSLPFMVRASSRSASEPPPPQPPSPEAEEGGAKPLILPHCPKSGAPLPPLRGERGWG